MRHSSTDELPMAVDSTQQGAQPSTRQRRILSVLVRAALPLGLLAIGGVTYSFLSVEVEKEKGPPVEAKALRTRVTKLQVRDYPVVITTNGLVQAHNEVSLSAQVSGQVTRVSGSFEAGSYFEKGELLVELDARDYVTAVAVADAQLLGAKSALQLAKEVHDRNAKLFEKKGVSEALLKQSYAAHAQAGAQVDTAAAAVEQSKRDLERTKIRAPFAGRVRQKSVGVGQSVGPGTPLGVVFTIEFAEVRLPIAGAELKYLNLPELADDSPVDVELRDAINKESETVWNAKIVRTEGTLDENSLELFVIARVDDPFGRDTGQRPLRIGQPVIASIAGKVLNDVVAVPRNAVRQLDQIFLVDEMELTLLARTLDPLWSDKEHIIVRDPSIQDGALLAMTRIVYAPEGAKVEIIPETTLTAAAQTNATKTKPVAN